MDYTVCSKVLETASKELKYAYDLLWHFIQENPNRVVINDKILEEYIKYANESGTIREWIKGMDFKKYWKPVAIDEFENLFIDTCRRTHDKRLIVCEKEDYNPINYNGITVFNKDEAISELQPAGIVINQSGNNNQATTGNNSSNIK